MRRLDDFERTHPQETWTAPSEVLLRDAHELCKALFPFYAEDAVHLEVQSLLSPPRLRWSTGPSASLVRADGARAQVGMVAALLEWIRFVWGSDMVPEVPLSMTTC